jgi:DNA-binding response OmpR family regulator
MHKCDHSESRPRPSTDDSTDGSSAAGAVDPSFTREVRVLVVDDDPMICKMMSTFLEGEGYQTTVVQDPAGLADLLSTAKFHIVLLDYIIPGADFEATLQTLHSSCPDACVIVITGYPSVDGAVSCIRHRVFDYLIKPFGIEDVRSAVSRALRFKGLERFSPKVLQSAIGKKIREARKGKGLTLGTLANRTNLSIGFLSQIELGKNSASVDTLYRIATALGLHPGTFFDDLEVEDAD